MEKKKMKLWKKILLVILLLLLIFVILTARKIIILNNLSDKISEYVNSKNAYVKFYSDDPERGLEYYESFKKDDVIKTVLKRNGENIYIREFDTPTERKVYIDTPTSKTMSIEDLEENLSSRSIVANYVYSNSFMETLMNSICSSIRSETLNGKECYVLSGLRNSNFFYVVGTTKIEIYLEKDTGLILQSIDYVKEEDGEKVTTVTYEYKFNELTDEDMKEPNIEDYELRAS